MYASGNHVKSMAKRVDKIASEIAKFTSCQNKDSPPPSQLESAASEVLITRETARRNPRPRIPAKEMR